MAAGSITVDLLLKTGTFETDTKRASSALKKMQQDAEATGKAIGLAFTGAVAGLAYMVKGAIDAADHLNDLSQKTGIAADALGGLGFAGSKAGLDLDSVAAGAGKLNKSLAEAAAGGAEATEAFAALGISVKDASGKTKQADVVIAEVADKFQSYADGPEKAAIALRLFGKAGADMIPLLNGGGKALQENIDYFKKYSGVTEESAQKADQFNDTIADIKLLTKAFATTLASELLPAMQAIAEAFKESKEQAGTFSLALSAIRVVVETVSVVASDLGFVLTQIGKGIVAVGESSAALARRDFSGAKTIFSAYNEQAAQARKSLDAFQAKVLQTDKFAGLVGSVDKFSLPNADKPSAPGLKKTGGGGRIDDPTKKAFENELKALESLFADERDLFQTRNRFLDLYQQQGLVSIQSYFDSRQAIATAALTSEQQIIDKEIALAEKRKASLPQGGKEQEEVEGKLAELRRRRERIEREAGEDSLALTFQQQQAYKALADSLLGVNAQVADLAENFRLAAAIKFEQQFGTLRDTFTQNGNAAGVEAIRILKDAALAQADYQKAALATSRTTEDLANAEARVAIALQTGAAGSLQALAQVGAARRAQIPILEAQVAAEEAIAAIEKAKGTPGADNLVRRAEAGRLALDKLKASADPLAESLNKVFGDDLNSALDDFVTGTKSAADSFHAFTKAILNDILKLGTKSITESIFGGSGGAGGFLSSLFGNGSSTGGLVSGLGSLFSGFFADGGVIPPGKFGVVGERGPEIAVGGTNGQTIVPKIGGGTTQNINVNVQGQPGQSRDSALQQGAAIGLGIQRAMARNT